MVLIYVTCIVRLRVRANQPPYDAGQPQTKTDYRFECFAHCARAVIKTVYTVHANVLGWTQVSVLASLYLTMAATLMPSLLIPYILGLASTVMV